MYIMWNYTFDFTCQRRDAIYYHFRENCFPFDHRCFHFRVLFTIKLAWLEISITIWEKKRLNQFRGTTSMYTLLICRVWGQVRSEIDILMSIQQRQCHFSSNTVSTSEKSSSTTPSNDLRGQFVHTHLHQHQRRTTMSMFNAAVYDIHNFEYIKIKIPKTENFSI